MASERPEADEPAKDTPDVFDVDRVRELVELMNQHDLSEIDLRQDELRLRLRRGADAPAVFTAPASVPTPAAAPAPAPAAAPVAAPTTEAAPAAEGTLIRSPMVGTFYSAANPDAAAYVKVGDQVGPETTVCMIEAMKVFNEIPAECSGKVTAVLAKNGDAVEFNQPLFRIE